MTIIALLSFWAACACIVAGFWLGVVRHDPDAPQVSNGAFLVVRLVFAVLSPLIIALWVIGGVTRTINKISGRKSS